MDISSFIKSWNDYHASKRTIAWLCLGTIAATVIVGFNWGGWVRGSTAQDLAMKAAMGARAELAATVCVQKFVDGSNVNMQLASLKAADTWKRDSFIEEGGWATLPGSEKPIAGAAALCSQSLLNLHLPLKAAKAG